MYNFTNFINKGHHALLQDLCGICEVSDVAESKDGDNLLPGDNGVYTATA